MTPILYLTFANNPDQNHLECLREEWKRLKDIFQPLGRELAVELEKKAEIDDLFDGFRDFGKRVVLFHYAGHAGQGNLLLEDTGIRGRSVADLVRAEGSDQLQLVFLNGCGTVELVDHFLESGAKAVLATSVSVGDRDALLFAKAFYRSLVKGNTLKGAFESARARLNAASDQTEQAVKIIYRDEGFAGNTDGEFPWGLYLPVGSDATLDWELADAIRDYTIGLPPLPTDIGLPNEPFKHLHYYTRADARVFFARSREIRKLYRMVTADTSSDPTSPDITLLYGPSGVGKSSLLFAGLVPRLEAEWDQPRYIRTDHLAELDHLQALAADPSDQKTIFIFDQLEELISQHPTQATSAMELFLKTLDQLFAQLPRGQFKAILGFRKEYFAEVEGILNRLGTSYEQLFLKPIDRAGIIQAVEGITAADEMRRKYKLTIEAPPPGTDKKPLPERIADYIQRDRQSNVGPVLQILLDKLWKKAKKENRSNPTFLYKDYEELEAAGLTLPAYLQEVIDELSTAGPEDPQRQSWWAETGLILDLLHYFITDEAQDEEKADQHTRAAVRARYAHLAAGELDALLKYCKDKSLLTELPDDKIAEERLRLSHDALAPVVRTEFEGSERPGQRAYRILKAKGKDLLLSSENRDRFGEADIAAIESGEKGMASLAVIERELCPADKNGALPELKFSLEEIVSQDQEFWQAYRQSNYQRAFDSAVTNIEHLQHSEALADLRNAHLVDLHPASVLEKAKELPYPLAFLRAKSKLQEAIELITDIPAAEAKHWSALKKHLSPADFPAENLFGEVQEWLRREDGALASKLQERFFPRVKPIAGGTFAMGAEGDELLQLREGPAHRVRVDPFQLGETPVTCWQYGLYCLATGKALPGDAGFGRGDRPVINVSWYEAVAYCNWLSRQEGLSPVYALEKYSDNPNSWHGQVAWDAVTDWGAAGYRLPTEAEWEFAASGRIEKRLLGGEPKINKWRFGNGENTVSVDKMNFDARPGGNNDWIRENRPGWLLETPERVPEFLGKTTPVKTFQEGEGNPTNPFELFDMSGNVYEWCWDWFAGNLNDQTDRYFMECREEGLVVNPRGAKSSEGKLRVVRGGSWNVHALACRSVSRLRYVPFTQNHYIGFRVSRR